MERIAAVPMRWYGDGLVIIEGGNGVVDDECGEGLWRCIGQPVEMNLEREWIRYVRWW